MKCPVLGQKIKSAVVVGCNFGGAPTSDVYFVYKDEVINNLRYLKDSALYKGISVQQDYTRNERTQIKELSDKAREMNISPPNLACT